MAFTSGFFNSKDGDRRYNARDFSTLFNGIINDGVFMSQGTQLRVTQGTNMTVNIGTGRAWFNGTWLMNDAIATITLEPGDLLLNRIDAIVIDVNEGDEIRDTSVKLIKGAVASTPVRPTLIKSAYHNQYPLAYIAVNKNASVITTSHITNMVGTSDTPFVTGILETMNIDGLIAQWGSQWDDWTTDQVDDFDAWEALFKATREEFQDDQELAFDTWFADIKGKLTSDVAGSIQVQIDAINAEIDEVEMDFGDRLEEIENTVWDVSKGGTGLTTVSNGMVLMGSSDPLKLQAVAPEVASTSIGQILSMHKSITTLGSNFLKLTDDFTTLDRDLYPALSTRLPVANSILIPSVNEEYIVIYNVDGWQIVTNTDANTVYVINTNTGAQSAIFTDIISTYRIICGISSDASYIYIHASGYPGMNNARSLNTHRITKSSLARYSYPLLDVSINDDDDAIYSALYHGGKLYLIYNDDSANTRNLMVITLTSTTITASGTFPYAKTYYNEEQLYVAENNEVYAAVRGYRYSVQNGVSYKGSYSARPHIGGIANCIIRNNKLYTPGYADASSTTFVLVAFTSSGCVIHHNAPCTKMIIGTYKSKNIIAGWSGTTITIKVSTDMLSFPVVFNKSGQIEIGLVLNGIVYTVEGNIPLLIGHIPVTVIPIGPESSDAHSEFIRIK